MLIFTGATYIKTAAKPMWIEENKSYYCFGYKWIKSKKRFNNTPFQYQVAAYEEITEDQLPK